MNNVFTFDSDEDIGTTVIGLTSLGLILMVFIIGGTIATGVITGLVAAIGFGFLLYKTKKHSPRLWNTMMDHPVLTDMSLSTLAVFLIAPTTLGGLVAGISCGVFASSGITIAEKYAGKVPGVKSYKLIPWNLPRLNPRNKKQGENHESTLST